MPAGALVLTRKRYIIIIIKYTEAYTDYTGVCI